MMKKKQPEGLVRIMKERKREDTIGSMMERVKMTQDAMERIQWEEKGCQQHQHGAKGRGVLQNTIVYGDDVHGDEEEPKFVRCPLSEVVDQLRLEEAEKKKRLEEKRMTARRNRLIKEEAELRSEEVEAEEKRRQRQQYIVKSIDGLGEDAMARDQNPNAKNKSQYGAHSHWDDCISTSTDSEEEEDDDDDTKEEDAGATEHANMLQCNYDRMILHAVDSVKKKKEKNPDT